MPGIDSNLHTEAAAVSNIGAAPAAAPAAAPVVAAPAPAASAAVADTQNRENTIPASYSATTGVKLVASSLGGTSEATSAAAPTSAATAAAAPKLLNDSEYHDLAGKFGFRAIDFGNRAPLSKKEINSTYTDAVTLRDSSEKLLQEANKAEYFDPDELYVLKANHKSFGDMVEYLEVPGRDKKDPEVIRAALIHSGYLRDNDTTFNYVIPK